MKLTLLVLAADQAQNVVIYMLNSESGTFANRFIRIVGEALPGLFFYSYFPI